MGARETLMNHSTAIAAIVLVLSTVSCSADDPRGPQGLPTEPMALPDYLMKPTQAVPMDPSRKVVDQDCSKAVNTSDGNLRCK
jgi:hypothetical protein